VRIVGVGVDVVDVARMGRILERHPRFASRHFSSHETAYCDARGAQRPAAYAARWAAKEAFAKALGGVPAGRWREVALVRTAEGAVSLSVEGRARDRMEAVGATEVHVSIAHERGVSVATCVAVGP
jgi:holo-[acyl-carrier protein] synthase